MDILYIITQADGGGAQRYTLALAKHFGGAIAAGTEDSALFNIAQEQSITTYPLKHLKRDIHFWHDFLAIFEIYALIKKVRPKIVHLNSTKAGFLGSIAGKLAGAKVVFTAHGFRYLEPLPPMARLFYRYIEKFASYFRDYVIAVSEVDRVSAVDNKIISPNKITAIHNGIPPTMFLPRDEAKKALGLEAGKKIIGAVANDYPTKGIDVLWQACRLITSNSQTVVYGHAPKKMADSNGKFQQPGYLAGASRYFKAFDIFVIPSRKEGFPFVLLEAMQAGLPVVATTVGGIPEALGDAGILVPPEDPAALAQALEELITNENLADSLSQKALERCKQFSEQKMLERTKKVYDVL